MSSAQLTAGAPRAAPLNLPRVALLVLLAALAFRAALFAAAGIFAIAYPYELDYGEGIVWQQMRWIFSDRAYGPIDGFPAIVFHYTPLYHALTAVIAGSLGTDELATGRAVSLLSTLAAAVASGLLVHRLLAGRADAFDARMAGAVAGLLVFIYLPVTHWAPLMRVDMLALALTLFGLLAAFAAVERPKLIHLASLLFVAAIYTKQTSIAAPAAAFGILLLCRPRVALAGLATSFLVGGSLLVALGWATDGGFYRHVFLYNVNRPDLGRLWWIAYVSVFHLFCIAAAVYSLAGRVRDLRSQHGRSPRRLLRGVGGNAADLRLLIAVGYLACTTVMLILVAKSGSSINYFLEWFIALGLFAATAPAEARLASSQRPSPRFDPAVLVPMLLTVQAFTTPWPRFDYGPATPRAVALNKLSAEISSSPKPVISDDMVLLLRSGQDVLWEPAIFAELASTGVWDERRFVERIRGREFSFFVTWGEPGHHRFDERYNPSVAAAIAEAYPVKQTLGGFTIHRPAAPRTFKTAKASSS